MTKSELTAKAYYVIHTDRLKANGVKVLGPQPRPQRDNTIPTVQFLKRQA